MKIILTGATGFLGSYIADELVAQGADVKAIVRPGSSLGRIAHLIGKGVDPVQLESSDAGSLERVVTDHAPDAVIHVAAKSRGAEGLNDLADFIEANITFGSHLAQAAASAGVKRMVSAGTSWQWSEDGSYRPFNFYAATKQAFEDILGHYANNGMECVSLRLFDVVGPNDDRNRIVDLLIDAGLRGNKLSMSPGNQHMFLLDVRDAARAFVQCAREPLDGNGAACNIYALRGGQSLSLRDLVDELAAATGLAVEVEFGGRPYRSGEIMRPYAGHATPPGWQPRVSLHETLADIFASRKAALHAT